MNLRPLLLLFFCGALCAEDEGVFEPGVQHVCVPAADGEGWDCGTDKAPPDNYRAPDPEPDSASTAAATVEPLPEPEPISTVSAVEEESPAPPPFLADPSRDTPYAPVDEPEPAASVAETAPAPAPAPEPVRAPTPEPVAPPPAPEPEPVVAAPTSVPPPVSEPVAPVAAAPIAPSPAVPASALAGAEAFAQLPATSFTLQLSYADSMVGFPQLVANLGLDPATSYVLRVRSASGAKWLLAHGAFADVGRARAAQAALPRVAGLSAQWPRRIGALQSEVAQGQ